jgi:serine/threonine protein kinase
MAKPQPPSEPAKKPLIETDPTTSARRLRARVAEVDAMNDLRDPDDPRLGIAERNLASDVRDIFGADSPEFSEYEHYTIWSGAMALNMSTRERLLARTNGLANAKVVVQSLVTLVEERAGTSAASPGAAATSKAETIGPWSLVKPLRRDGQGEVFLVGRRGYALGVLKRVPHDVTGDAKRLARFKHEIQIVAKLRHPFIAEVLDTNLDGEMWFVTRFAPLGSLLDNVRWFKGDVWRTLRLGRDIATALQAAHAQNVIHRDVKPGNILLYDPDHFSLTDFGIAHHPDHTKVTDNGEKVGPGWFLPPEAEHGRSDDVDPTPPHDVYMLGKLLYYVLTGGKQFLRERFTEGTANIELMFGRPEFACVNKLLGRMIVEDPTHRFQTMDQVIAEIDVALTRLYRRGSRDGGHQLIFNVEFWSDETKAIDSGPLQSGRHEVAVPPGSGDRWMTLRVGRDNSWGNANISNLVIHALCGED